MCQNLHSLLNFEFYRIIKNLCEHSPMIYLCYTFFYELYFLCPWYRFDSMINSIFSSKLFQWMDHTDWTVENWTDGIIWKIFGQIHKKCFLWCISKFSYVETNVYPLLFCFIHIWNMETVLISSVDQAARRKISNHHTTFNNGVNNKCSLDSYWNFLQIY